VSDPSRKRGLPMQVKMRHDTHFVEELAARSETPVGRMLPISAIEPDPDQPRSSLGDLDDLVASIRAKGVLEPVLVRPRPADAGAAALGLAYRIISGERRYRAAQEAGLYEVPAIEMDVTEQEAVEIALIENLQRKDLTPFEEAEGFRRLAEVHGYTHEEISEAVGKSRTVVTESLSLLQMSPRVRDTVQALGLNSKSLLLEVIKAGSETDMISLLEEVARLGLNRDDLRRRLRRNETAKGTPTRRPYVFRFKAPDKTFSLALTFRQTEVDKSDLIQALEKILTQLRTPA
jgi:ParB family chromosome partitioning protein